MARDPAVSPVIRGKLRGAAADRVIRKLAARQHEVVALAQLLAMGVSKAAIENRVARGWLRRVCRGVYTTCATPLSTDGRCLAAVLAAGSGAVASHRSAGAVWGLLRSGPARHEVTVPRARRQSRTVRFHYGAIEADEITTCRGIPVTTVSRTILDMAEDLTPARVGATIRIAEDRRLTDSLSLDDLLQRYPRRCGVGTIRQILAEMRFGANRTRSELEEAFLDFLDHCRLPRPETNVWLKIRGRWIEADCVWREQQLIAELDGAETHLIRSAFEGDRARDRRLAAAEWRPIRVTWRHLHRERDELEADLRVLLSS